MPRFIINSDKTFTTKPKQKKIDNILCKTKKNESKNSHKTLTTKLCKDQKTFLLHTKKI